MTGKKNLHRHREKYIFTHSFIMTVQQFEQYLICRMTVSESSRFLIIRKHLRYTWGIWGLVTALGQARLCRYLYSKQQSQQNMNIRTLMTGLQQIQQKSDWWPMLETPGWWLLPDQGAHRTWGWDTPSTFSVEMYSIQLFSRAVVLRCYLT